jgi:hypothetical protein
MNFTLNVFQTTALETVLLLSPARDEYVKTTHCPDCSGGVSFWSHYQTVTQIGIHFMKREFMLSSPERLFLPGGFF